MPSLTQWTWVWASSRRWWRTGKPGMLQSVGLQRVRHDWETEQQHYPILCICHILFTHWWTLKLLPLRCSDSATVNISVQISVWVLAFRSLGYIPKHGIAGLYGNSMFKFWGTAMLCYTILHSHQQWREILFLHVLAPDSWCLQLIKVFVKVPCTVQAKPTLAIAWNCSALGNRLATSLWQNACSSISISKKWR